MFLFALWWWLIIIESSILLVVASREAEDALGVSGISFGVFLALLYWWADVDFITLIQQNIKLFTVGTVSYFVVGLFWSIFKWYRYCVKKREEYQDRLAQGTFKVSVKDYIPEFRKSKGYIVLWITHWPFSLFWAILSDLLKEIGSIIAEQFKSVFSRITDRVFKQELK